MYTMQQFRCRDCRHADGLAVAKRMGELRADRGHGAIGRQRAEASLELDEDGGV
jgi:hypothetical protein